MVDDHFDEQYCRAVQTGEDNSAVMQHCKGWCEHVVVETLAVSMVGQMLGLPIGPHRISCQYAKTTLESGNLRNLFGNFIETNCIGCPHYSTGSSPQFGRTVIDTIISERARTEEIEAERQETITQLRGRLRSSADAFAASAQTEAASIHRLAANLFSDKSNEDIVSVLFEATKVAPEFFDDDLVELLMAGLSDSDCAEGCLRILGSLARAKPQIRSSIAAELVRTLHTNISLETVSEAVDACLVTTNELTDADLNQLFMRLDHQQQIGGSIVGVKTYSNSIALLQRIATDNEERLISVIRGLFAHESSYVRANACETARKLAAANLSFGVRLLPAVIAMLEIPEEMGFGASSDHAAREYISEMLAEDWENAHRVLLDETKHRSSEVRAAAYGAYEKLFRRGPDWRNETLDGLEVTTVEAVVAQCLSNFHDSTLPPNVRLAAAEALKSATAAGANQVLVAADRILGTFVLLSNAAPPPVVSRIIIPGLEAEHANDDFVRKQQALSDWERLKHETKELLEEIGRHAGREVCDTLVIAIESERVADQTAFQAEAIALLGEIASQDTSLVGLTLSALMKGMMDFSNPLIRATSLQAAANACRHCTLTIPENIGDVVILHLLDTNVYVHKTAVGALRYWRLPFNQQQKQEAFLALVSLWKYYTKQPNEFRFVDDLAEAILSVAWSNEKMKVHALRLIARIIPCGELLVDKTLCELLLRHTKYEDRWALDVSTAVILAITKHLRDRYNSLGDWRERALTWLHQTPKTLWERINDHVVEAALKCIACDPFDAIAFASICSEHGDRVNEHRLLQAGAIAAKGHALFHGLEEPLRKLADNLARQLSTTNVP